MIEYLKFDGALTMEEVEKKCDEYVNTKTEGKVEGLPTPIRMIKKETVKNKEIAESIFQESDYGYYDSMALKVYLNVEKLMPKYETLLNEIMDLQSKILTLRTPHFEDFKSKLFSCKACGSKLATEYLKTITCPLCENDLRPESIKEREKKLHTRLEKKEKERKGLEDKGKDKPSLVRKEMWYVKIEY